MIILFLFLMIVPISLADSCREDGLIGGELEGTSVTDPSECASCHVKIVPIYKSLWGRLTKDVIGHDVQCASEYGMFIDKMWLGEDEFSERYPVGEGVEVAIQGIALENANIELEKLMYIEKKRSIKESNLIAWGLNVAIIKLVIELLRIVIYVVELWFLIYFMLNLIPNFFFKIRDSIVDLYVRKRGK